MGTLFPDNFKVVFFCEHVNVFAYSFCLLTSLCSTMRDYREIVVVRTLKHIKSSSHKSIPLKFIDSIFCALVPLTVLDIYKHCTNLKLYFAHWNFFNNITYLLSGKILVKTIRNLNQNEMDI